ncbi:hypothetical protein BLGI_1510 [Brevibacillus laterosporus GI-9]|nr:hypothetical protein BLGI_1510 [Brevibacillus laterosporus GI-9]
MIKEVLYARRFEYFTNDRLDCLRRSLAMPLDVDRHSIHQV